MSAEPMMAAPAVVLRDVVLDGHVALPQSGRLRTVPASQRADSAASVLQPRIAVADAPSNVELAEEDARRRGYEDGFAKGSVEGRAQGDEEARKAAQRSSEQAARDLESHTERVSRDLQQQAQAGYQARMHALDSLLGSLPAQVEARLAAAQDDMLALCFEVVCKIFGYSAQQQDAVRGHLSQAMTSLHGRRLVAVHLHPDDLAMLEEMGASSKAGLPGRDVQWVGDASVILGGCVLQSPEGGLDARFETQLAALRELLLHTRAAGRTGGVA